MQRSVVYQEPLKLERGHDGTFLETRFTIENNAFRYKLKNDNEQGGETKVWRYICISTQTRLLFRRERRLQRAREREIGWPATLAICMSARWIKWRSSDILRRVRYPLGLLRKACAYIAATSGVRQWLDVATPGARSVIPLRPSQYGKGFEGWAPRTDGGFS